MPLPIEAVLPGIDEAAAGLSATGGGTFSDAITTTDRWPKRCTLKLGGVTLSAQAKGAGMIEPNMATMLCFVQTDAVVADPAAELRRGGRRLLQPDHRRRADEHQRLRPPAGHRRQRRAASRGAAGGGADPAGDRDRPRRRGRGPGRAIAVSEAAERRRGRAGRPRDRQLAAGQDGALRPRPQLGPDRPGRRARRWPARTSTRSAPTRSTPPSLAPRPRRPRSACASAAASTAPRSGSPTSATSTSGSTRSTRPEPSEAGADDDRAGAAVAQPERTSRPCSRRCPTSASSTAAPW